MYLTMSWPVDDVLSLHTDDVIEFDGGPCEWEEPDLDEYLDVAILLHGVKGDRVSLVREEEGFMCHIRFIVPDGFPGDAQEQLADHIAGGLSDGFGEDGLRAHGHDVYLDLNLDDDPRIVSAPGPTVLPTLAALAAGGSVDALRAGIDTAKANNTLESAFASTLETMKPLALAVGSGEVDKVQLLLDAGINPNGDGSDSPIESTALVNTQCLPDVAAVEMAERLLASGANIRDPAGLAKKAENRGKSKLAKFFHSLET